jgi:hypothetical protein
MSDHTSFDIETPGVQAWMGIAPAVIHVMWRREMLRYFRERSQFFGGISRTILWLVILGFGLGAALREIEGYTYAQYILPGVMTLNVLYASLQCSIALVWDREVGFAAGSGRLPRAHAVGDPGQVAGRRVHRGIPGINPLSSAAGNRRKGQRVRHRRGRDRHVLHGHFQDIRGHRHRLTPKNVRRFRRYFQWRHPASVLFIRIDLSVAWCHRWRWISGYPRGLARRIARPWHLCLRRRLGRAIAWLDSIFGAGKPDQLPTGPVAFRFIGFSATAHDHRFASDVCAAAVCCGGRDDRHEPHSEEKIAADQNWQVVSFGPSPNRSKISTAWARSTLASGKSAAIFATPTRTLGSVRDHWAS